MIRSTLTSKFLAGWEPSGIPARGPHGVILAGPPKRLPIIDAPTLCEAGPCRNYHRLVSVMETQAAIGEPDANEFDLTVRTCYPAPGIEIDLGETPVQQCSRWEPDNGGARGERDEARRKFLATNDGKKFSAEVRDYEQVMEAAKQAAYDRDGFDKDAEGNGYGVPVTLPTPIAPVVEDVAGSLAAKAPSDAALDELAVETHDAITPADAQELKSIADELGIDIDDEGNEVAP